MYFELSAEIKLKLELHAKWLRNEEGGERANLSWATLSGANFLGADLSSANLRGANLSGATLSGANLRGVNLDFSSYPLWCGSLSAELDQKHIVQLLFHAAKPAENNKLEIDADIKQLLKSKLFIKVLQKFHREDVEKYTGDI